MSVTPGKAIAATVGVASLACLGYCLANRFWPVTAASNPALAGRPVVVLAGAIAAATTPTQRQAATAAHVIVYGNGFLGECTSGSAGRFALQVPARGRYSVLATVAGDDGELLGALTAVDVANSGPPIAQLTLVARPTGMLLGQVALPGGAGATVWVGGTTLGCHADAHGGFALANVPAGCWDLVVRRAGYTAATVRDLDVVAGKPLTLVSPIELTASTASSGLALAVRDAADSPVPGVPVSAFGAGLPFGVATTLTDARGSAALLGLRTGPVRLQVDAAPAGREVVLAGPLVQLGRTRGAARALASVHGQVVDRAGTGLAGASVSLDPPLVDAVQTDAQGSFVWEQVPVGDYTLEVASPEHAPLARGLHVTGSSVALGAALRLEDAFADTLSTTPAGLLPIDFNLASPASRTGSGAAGSASKAAEDCYPVADAPPKGYALVTDLAAPLLATGRDRAGHALIQWHPIVQDPVCADPASQYLDVRYDIEYYTPDADAESDATIADGKLVPRELSLASGTWCELQTLSAAAIEIGPSFADHRFRVAAYAWKGPEIVYGGWSYLEVGAQ